MVRPIFCRRAGNRGFTLVELMAAMSVLVISALAAVSTGLSTLNLTRTSKDTSTAMSDLQSAMERVLALPHDNIATTYPSGTAIAGYNHLLNETIIPTYPLGTTADPLEIRLTITFQDFQKRNRTLTISSRKTR